MAKPVRRSGNLPAEATSFVGRRHELAEIKKKLVEARLVSLVGPGGVGKTRLAIRAASDLGRRFRDGAWLVELAEVQDSSLTSNAVRAALGLRDQAAAEPQSSLLSFLQDKQLLLVMDNCEHLLPAVAQLVAEVLQAAPGVRVVATSREPLTLAGEHVVPIPPLQLPSAELGQPLSHLGENEAVMLLVDRSTAATGAFELSAVNRDAVVELCRRLDGLPLAIELAAVRTRVLSLQQIVERLSDRFGLLTKGSPAALPRHQTLRMTIDWSHDLLSTEERTLLRRLCVFGGRFTLEDVEGVCVAEALDLVSSLVDKSLVIKEDVRGVACYRLHETMREYALLKLKEAGEEESINDRCADHYRLQVQRFGSDPRNHLLEWLAWVELELDNLRSVLHRSLVQGDTRGIELVSSMGWYWFTRATSEGVRWLDQLLAPTHRDSAEFGRACFVRGFLAVLRADAESARLWLGRAVSVARRAEDSAMLTHSLSLASIAHRMTGDRASAAKLLDEARSTVSHLDDPASHLSVLQTRAINGFFDGDLDDVREATSQGVRISRDTNDLYALEVMLGELGGTALIAGDHEEAKPLYAEGLRIARQIDDRVTQFYFVDGLAYIAARAGHARLAAQLLGASQSMRNAAGARALAFMTPLIEQAEDSAAAALGAARFKAEVEAGRHLSLETALRLALGESTRTSDVARDGADTGLLGKRESDVARLVAEGLSNKQIAARLFISQRTVDSHVRNILDKLGFISRAQIAAWIGGNRQPLRQAAGNPHLPVEDSRRLSPGRVPETASSPGVSKHLQH